MRPPFPLPRPHACARLAALLSLLLLTAAASAQPVTWRLGAVGAGSGSGPYVTVQVDELGSAAQRFTAAATVSAEPGVELESRAQRAFGPLGTVMFETRLAGRLAGEPFGRAALTLRGSLGPVAARWDLRVAGAPDERFRPEADPGRSPFARDASTRLQGSWRPSAAWLLSFDAGLHSDMGGTFGWDAQVTARGRRLLGPERDGAVTVQASGVGHEGLHAALGWQWTEVPRRAPETSLGVWIEVRADQGAVRVAPGATLSGNFADEAGGRLTVEARARPLSPQRAPWLLQLRYRPAAGSESATSAFVTVRSGGSAGNAVTAGVEWVR